MRKGRYTTTAKVSLLGDKIMVSVMDVSSAFDVRKPYEMEHLQEMLELLDKASITTKQAGALTTLYRVPLAKAVLLKQILSHKSFLINKRRLSNGVHQETA